LAINEKFPEEYNAVDWKITGGKNLALHRLCVKPGMQGKGFAKKLVIFAENFASMNHYKSIRLDAFSKNPAALKLYESMGYNKAGSCNFRKGLFFCFEKEMIQLRKAAAADIDEILYLFNETVMSAGKTGYNGRQLRAWASSSKDRAKWAARVGTQYFLVAEKGGRITGFGSLEKGEYLDLLYAHKDFIKTGTGEILLLALEKESARLGSKHITADVSIPARSFFEKHGYSILSEQKKIINGVEIKNYKMFKVIGRKSKVKS
jgi:putative acetyltransferase